MKNTLYIISVCLLLLGCVKSSMPVPVSFTSRTVSIYIDSTFTLSEIESITYGIEKWNHALNGHLILRIEEESLEMSPILLSKIIGAGDYIIFGIDSSQSRVSDSFKFENGEKKIVSRTLAYCDEIGGHYVYLLMDRLSELNLSWVVMHEIGHLLGVSHQSSGLMFHYYRDNNWRCIDNETLRQVSEIRYLPFNDLRGCESDLQEGQ